MHSLAGRLRVRDTGNISSGRLIGSRIDDLMEEPLYWEITLRMRIELRHKLREDIKELEQS